MTEYLSKEEIKQWRSSLEKITLEAYAARLGKVISEEKSTNDIVDIVLKNDSGAVHSYTTDNKETISGIGDRAFEREKRLSHTPFSMQKPVEESKKSDKKEIKEKEDIKSIVDNILPSEIESKDVLREEVNIVLKKSLTDREQLVFDYFLNNKNKTVFAKDLASLLDLPRDYVYKYIKNLRAKIDGDRLKNAENGGFILTL